MNDESRTLKGWPAVRMFFMLAVTPVITALTLALPIAWLINHVFANGAIHAVFGVERLGYWKVVGLFAIRFAIRGKIELQVKPKNPGHLDQNQRIREANYSEIRC